MQNFKQILNFFLLPDFFMINNSFTNILPVLQQL
jgi:hypothetical protein